MRSEPPMFAGRDQVLPQAGRDCVADVYAQAGAVNSQHRHVRSSQSDPVQYNAFDPELQLWVAACLYMGLEDVYEILHGAIPPETGEVLYRHGARLGTTLQVTDEMWPPDRDAFYVYWDDMVGRIEMDDLTREYLQGIAGARFLPHPIDWIIGPYQRLMTGDCRARCASSRSTPTSGTSAGACAGDSRSSSPRTTPAGDRHTPGCGRRPHRRCG